MAEPHPADTKTSHLWLPGFVVRGPRSWKLVRAPHASLLGSGPGRLGREHQSLRSASLALASFSPVGSPRRGRRQGQAEEGTAPPPADQAHLAPHHRGHVGQPFRGHSSMICNVPPAVPGAEDPEDPRSWWSGGQTKQKSGTRPHRWDGGWLTRASRGWGWGRAAQGSSCVLGVWEQLTLNWDGMAKSRAGGRAVG